MVSRLLVAAVAGAVLSTPVACKPNLDDTVSIVSSARVLAIQSSPAEAPPTTPVTFTALVARGSGPDAGAGAGAVRLVWDYCNARNPLKNLGPVNILCTQQGDAYLAPLGSGLTVAGGLPTLGCSNFGPNAPPAMDGGPAGQPVSPDFTGGYYQPVTVFASEASAAYDSLYFMRLSCGFAGANESAQAALTARYHPNANPEVASLGADGKALAPTDENGKNSVTRGTKVTLDVSWPVCPLVDTCGDGICGPDESVSSTTPGVVSCPKDCMPPPTVDGGAPPSPRGCGGAERFVNFDLSSQEVVDQREGIHVSWYATDGAFDQDRTGVGGTDTATDSANGWTPPSNAGTVTLWIVLRDDRGGIGWREYRLAVN